MALPLRRRFLAEFPALVLVGPRQVGKTTLALDIVKGLGSASGQLLGLRDLASVLAHPVAGASWEGLVLEQLLAAAPAAAASFYRTSHGAEAELVLSYPSGQT